jgi:hypothetical protein
MTRHRLVIASAALLATIPLLAQLSTPLTLPPGGVEVLPIDSTGSYMGDAVRIVDCPNPADEPFGTCGNELFGGVALWNSHLKGALQIRFNPAVNGVSHFEVTHPFNLTGDDVLMTMPQLYIFGMSQNAILDTFNSLSSGDLNLATGQVTNLSYNVIFFNLWYGALGVVNPKLKPPPFQFPGTYGSAQATFTQRPDGLLDFTFYGSTFLPLGGSVSGDPVRLPLPFSGPELELGSIEVPGMGLHPHLSITTKPNLDPPCAGALCPSIPFNSVVQLTLNAAVSNIGDDYTLNIPQLGPTPAPGSVLPEGHTEVQGRVQVQFGGRNGNFVPVAFHGLPPEGLVAPTPPFPIPGLSLGLLGPDTHLVFPLQTYVVAGTVIADDPFDFSVGELDLATGQLVGGLLWRSFWNHTLLTAILTVNAGKLDPFSFQQRGPAQFQTGPNGELLFRFNSTTVLPYTGFIFPSPNYASKVGFTGGPGSILQPFVRLQAALPTDAPTGVMSGAQTNVTSSFGETFSYSYSVPCAGSGGTPAFTYTNTSKTSHGGTFTMTNLSSVSCTNSLTSTKPVGNYDTIQFSGYGLWSGDANLHIATVHVSTAPSTPYVSIMIDGGQLSNVDIAPAKSPIP